MEQLALALAFIIELLAFIGFAALGLLLPVPRPAQLGLCVILLVALIAFWGRYMAPRAANPLPLPLYYAAKALVYIPACFMILKLYADGSGIIFGAAIVLNELALYKHNAARLSR
jgi:hypothetical protein